MWLVQQVFLSAGHLYSIFTTDLSQPFDYDQVSNLYLQQILYGKIMTLYHLDDQVCTGPSTGAVRKNILHAHMRLERNLHTSLCK